MLKKLGYLIVLAATAFVSCSNDKSGNDKETPAIIEVTNEDLNFTAIGGEAIVGVSASGEWDAVTSAAWIKLTKSNTLSKQGSVAVTVSENTSTESRTGEILFMSGQARKSVAVSQTGREPEPVDENIAVPDGYKLVWHDEFDGTALNRTDWTYEVQGPGWVNNELQNYVAGDIAGRKTVELNDGILSINCIKHNSKIYSSRIYAKVNSGWKYGIFEARIKLPKGKGTWPAYWMMPVNNDFGTNPWPLCGEIDIMEEVGYNPDYTSSSIHCDAYNHVKGTQKTAERLTQGAQDEFHIYSLEWDETGIYTSVDGKRLLTFRNDGSGNVRTWPFDKAFYLILNLAWGGDWGGAQGVDEGALPATMQVDYVRVFQKNN